MDLSHVQPGQPVPPPSAAFRNAMVDAIVDHRRRLSSVSGGALAISSGDSGIVLVKNASGYDCDRFHVLGIDTVRYEPADHLAEFKNRIILEGVTSSLANHSGKFVVLLEPVRDGTIGRAMVSGVCQVQVDVINSSHGWADVKDNDRAALQSGATGTAQILWKETGTGVLWALVRLTTTHDAAPMMRVYAPYLSDGFDRKLPKYGVVPISGIYPPSSYAYSERQYKEPNAGTYLFAINDGNDLLLEAGSDIVDTPYKLAFDEPAIALMSAAGRALSGATATGIPLGMIPQTGDGYLDDQDDAFCLWPYLPGFRAVHSQHSVPYTVGEDTYYKALVLQDPHQHLWGKAKYRCVPHFYAYPNSTDVVEIWPCSPPSQSTGVASVIYDGTTTSPEITLTVQIMAVSGREPNIQEGDYILYKATPHVPIYSTSYRGLLAVSAHYDDPIGTVKLWNAAAAAVPPGWRQIDMSTPRFLRGGNYLGSGSFGGSGSTYAYQQYLVIERYQ